MTKRTGTSQLTEVALRLKGAVTPKRVPFAFVLEELDALAPATRLMFGCTAVYVGPRIVMALREKGGSPDDGVWIATTADHHASLRAELPSIRSIGVLGGGVTGWQVIPASAESFEEEALRACALVRSGDPRVGKLPKAKPRSAPAKKPR